MAPFSQELEPPENPGRFSIDTSHAMVQWLGLPAATWLTEHYAGESIGIPRGADYVRLQRDADIRQQRAAGASAAQLALDYGLTERQVWRILSQRPTLADNQICMFLD